MILVTGASGTVGSEVVKALGGRSARVRALSDTAAPWRPRWRRWCASSRAAIRSRSSSSPATTPTSCG